MRKNVKALTAWLEPYLEDCLARGQSDRTVEGKRYTLTQFIRWCAGEKITRITQITEETLEGYRRYLYRYRQSRNDKPLTVATQRKRLTDVKVYLERLRRFHVINTNPAADFDLPRVPRRLPRAVLTVPEIEAMMLQTALHGLPGLRDRAVLETYYATGIRRMELARLDIDDVDLKKEVVTINNGKGGNDRRAPIARRACDWIRRYLRDVRPKLATLESGQTLFLANNGKRFKEQQLTRIASKYVKRAGIKKRGACNLFRHATGTLMHEAGADIRDVQEMLGHADISTTQIYTHVTIRKLREVYLATHPAARSTPISSSNTRISP